MFPQPTRARRFFHGLNMTRRWLVSICFIIVMVAFVIECIVKLVGAL